jgi:hypothetical protein
VDDGCSPPRPLSVQFEIQNKRMLFKESVDCPEENPPPLAMNNFHFKNTFFPAYPQIFIHNRCGLFRLKRVEIKGPVNRELYGIRFIHDTACAQKIPLPSPPSAIPSILLRAVSLTNGSGRAAFQKGEACCLSVYPSFVKRGEGRFVLLGLIFRFHVCTVPPQVEE